MTTNERKVTDYVKQSLGDMVWCWENTILDTFPGTEEYQTAVRILSQPLEALVKMVVDNAFQELASQKWSKNAMFAGRKMAEEYTEKRLKKAGYPKTF